MKTVTIKTIAETN